MTINELKDFIAQQAVKFNDIDNESDYEWEILESCTFKKVFDFIVTNGYFLPPKNMLEDIEDGEWCFISAMEMIDETKEQMPLDAKDVIEFFNRSFYPEQTRE